MKKFELCFQLPNSYTYIIPELLPAGQPAFNWEYNNNLRFEYHYSFMPAGIITRFIVRTHDLNSRRIYWKNGAVLVYENTLALVTGDRLNRKIRIRIYGSNKKSLFAIIRREIDYIHGTLNHPDAREMVLCTCSECSKGQEPFFHEYKRLKDFTGKGIPTAQCGKSGLAVSIAALSGEIELQVSAADLKIGNAEKEFVIRYFAGESELDSLCRELGLSSAPFTGNFEERITQFINHLERRKANPACELKTALLNLRPQLAAEIEKLFAHPVPERNYLQDKAGGRR